MNLDSYIQNLFNLIYYDEGIVINMGTRLDLKIDELESIKLNDSSFWTAFGIGAGAGTFITAAGIVAYTVIT